MNFRTRFAPSPTGYLHVGGLRAALYNYLFARRQSGTFILRIEDTDQTREVPGAVENLINIFEWTGLDFDEGPHVGGAFGPYIQSERIEIYREHTEKLAAKGAAYPCFCSAGRLESMRAEQNARGVPPMYDRLCRSLSKDEAGSRMAGGEPHVWRMAVPARETVAVQDLIRGRVEFASETIDDQVLVKSDGFPTYHLANVVDDHLMQISHVIRGEEWLPSAPKHVLLYEAFGWEPPQFAHLPLILNADRSKMSKRTGDVAVEAYREKGYVRDALLNFVALLGWHPADDRELFSVDELVREFSLDRVQKAGAVFDVSKLRWMSAEYIKRESDEELYAHIASHLPDVVHEYGERRVKIALQMLRAGAETYVDLATRLREIFAQSYDVDAEAAAILDSPSARLLLTDFAGRIDGISQDIWDSQTELESAFKSCAAESSEATGLKGKSLWHTLRAGMTGTTRGPEMAKLIGVWGRERVLKNLNSALQKTDSLVKS